MRWSVKLLFISLVGVLPGMFLLRSLQAAELSEIEQRGHLIVGVKDNWRPLGFRQVDGELAGLEIDIARQLSEELWGEPDRVVFHPLSNADRIDALLRGEVDLVIAGLSVSESRSRLVSFSTPYYYDGTALITRQESLTMSEATGATPIAVLNGSDAVATLRSQFPLSLLVPVESYLEALSLLDAGQADAFAGDVTVLTGWAQENPDYRVLPNLLSAEALAIAAPKGNQYADLRSFVNEAIAQWYEEGWLQQRVDYWGLPW